MRAVIQRVAHADVVVDGKTVGACGKGYMILLGVADGDTEAEAEMLCRKILNLRIFPDDAGKMNRSILDIDGEMLIISQFTLLANYRHGNRPDFLASAKPDEANRLYEYFKSLAAQSVRRVESGIFGAHMEVSLMNEGPVTIVMDSEELKRKK